MILFRATVKCPRCQSSRCRESRWLSLEEKRSHQESCPYRCLDCSYRFLFSKRSIPEFDKGLAVSLPIALVAIALAVTATWWLTGDEPAAALSSPVTIAALDPDIRKSAEAGDADAQFRLGEALLLDPARSAENSEKAVHWLQAAAENGNTDAMIVLGRLSRTGVGVLQNFDLSAKWLHTAAARGSSEGMLELARLYRDGIGVEKDLVRAYVWFNRASAIRNIDAVRERDAIARALTPEELKAAQKQSAVIHPLAEKPSTTSRPD